MKLRMEITHSVAKTSLFEHQGPRVEIGRDPACALAFQNGDADSVSWKHALIELTPDGAFLRDLESSNGTFVNDKRIEKRTRLEAGDHIRLGREGPYLRLLIVDLTGAFKKEKPKADVLPLPAPDAPPSPPCSPNQTLATRVYVKLMESRYRKLWIGSGVMATCSALFFGVVLMDQSGSIRSLFGQTKDLGQQSKDLGQQANEIKGDVEKANEAIAKAAKAAAKANEDLATFLAGDAETIRKKFGDSVYLVAKKKSDGSIEASATAFVIDKRGKFGTNGHVAFPIRNDIKKGGQWWLVSVGGRREYEVIGAEYHPEYIEWPDRKIRYQTPDVGILTVRLPIGDFLSPEVELASEPDLRRLAPGAQLCYIGFPGWYGAKHSYPSVKHIEPRLYAGCLTRITTLKGETADYSSQALVEHDMSSIGGASGSPIFDRRGKVVAVHNSGLMLGIDGIPVGPKMGIRIDRLTEMLK